MVSVISNQLFYWGLYLLLDIWWHHFWISQKHNSDKILSNMIIDYLIYVSTIDYLGRKRLRSKAMIIPLHAFILPAESVCVCVLDSGSAWMGLAGLIRGTKTPWCKRWSFSALPKIAFLFGFFFVCLGVCLWGVCMCVSEMGRENGSLRPSVFG